MANQRNEPYPVDSVKAKHVAAWLEFFRDIFAAGANIAETYACDSRSRKEAQRHGPGKVPYRD